MNMRNLLPVAAVLLAVTACSSGTSSANSDAPAADKPTGSTGATGYDGPTIPDGVYIKTVTTRGLRKMGLEPAQFDAGLSPQGTALVAYKFQAGAWTQFAGPSEEQLAPGSHGTLRYETGGRLVLSESCCGDSVIRWDWDGTRLTMTLRSDDQGPLPIDHVMRDGVYNKDG